MSAATPDPLITVGLPVYNGANTLGAVIESVLAQTYSRFELLISDNASTDATTEICRQYAAADSRVTYHRHPVNVGPLRNFESVAETARGSYVRWIGDSDWLHQDYLTRTSALFAENPRLAVVTTQMTYFDDEGRPTLDQRYDPVRLSSADPVDRFTEVLRLLNGAYEMLDPLYGVMRRELATLPRRYMLREDEVFAARLALAGPWGHVAAPLASRHRAGVRTTGLVSLLGVPRWHRALSDLLQRRELIAWIARSDLDEHQRRRARAAVDRFYLTRKMGLVPRTGRRLRRMVRRTDVPGRMSS